MSRDAVAHMVWLLFERATAERRELTRDEAVQVAELMEQLRRRYRAAAEDAGLAE